MGKQLTKHFNEDEFRCRHCGALPEGGMDPKLIHQLECLRCKVGKPLTINSGFRCATHNKNVGGAKSSQHLKGTAADVRVPRGMTTDQLAKVAEEVGFDGIGKYPRQGFVHVDVRGFSARWHG